MPSSPLVLYEDEHLLVINKPAGINTHKPGPFAPDGIHEWLTKQRPQWRSLAVLHRLDRETSGVLLFGKTTAANRAITEQFDRGTLTKRYVFLSPANLNSPTVMITHPIEGKAARTEFRRLGPVGRYWLIEARPLTGRIHQVRIHARAAAVPVLGDERYGDTSAGVPRMMLHAAEVECRPTRRAEPVRIRAPLPRAFAEPETFVCAREFREGLFAEEQTDAYRLVAGAADGFPGVTVDRYGPAMLVRRATAGGILPAPIQQLAPQFHLFTQEVRPGAASRPRPSATSAPLSLFARENGLRFLIRMDRGFSPGLFPDQRENRRRLRELAGGKQVLNCFAYTGSFSVAAAAAGGATTSVDLSRGYLEWGRENFRANGLDLGGHEFLYGDVFDWLDRFARRGRSWDIVLLDPPTFGTSKRGRVFRASRDFGRLVHLAARVVRAQGILFCSTNQQSLCAGAFRAMIEEALRAQGRRAQAVEYETLPFDFRVARGETAYLKTFWLWLA